MGSNIPKIGTSDIVGCYIGNTEIEKVYLGSDAIYEKSVTPTEKTYTWNYELVGDSSYQVNVQDGIISNLTSKSYITLPSTLRKTYTPTTFEAVFYFNTGDLSTWGIYSFGLNLLTNSTGSSPSLRMAATKTNMQGYASMYSGTSSPYQKSISTPNDILTDNTNYRMSMIYDKSTSVSNFILFNVDTEMEIYNGSFNVPDAVIIASNYLIVGKTDNSPAVNGMSIDLNKSYIKIDGSLIQDITENT